MPELAETASENTEFSEETISETQNDVAVDRPKAFPSISDVFLTQLKLCQGNKDKTDDPERTSEQETEDKFNRLSLAFKTDKITLDKRIELHQRARDVAEQNIDKEMVSIKEALQLLDPLCKDSKSRDVFGEIKQHVEVLDHSSTRMSSRAEILGAVKQEQRISEAIEVMIEHVENLKQTLDKEHEELEKTKKLLRENRLLGGDGDGGLPRRALSLSAKVGRRRASVAVLPRPLVLPSPIVKTINITDDLDPKVKLQNLISDSIRRASRALVNSNPVRRASIALEQLKSSSLTPKHSSSFKRTLSQNSAGNSPLAVVQENNDSAKLHDSEDGTSSDREHQQESSTECRHSDDPHSSKDVPRTSSHSSLALPDLERLQQLAQTSSSFEDEGDDDIMEADMPEYNLVEQLVELLPDWKQFMHHFRYTAAGMIFVLGVLMLMLTLIPRGSAESSQGVDGWGILEHTLWPYLEIKSTGMHPT